MNNYWAFIDLDDTLCGVSVGGEVKRIRYAYLKSEDTFITLMGTLGHSSVVSRGLFRSVHKMYREIYGFSDVLTYPLAMTSTYKKLSKKEFKESVEDRVFEIGMSVYDYEYAPLPGALSTLEALKTSLNIAVVTKGPLNIQKKKMLQSGVWEFSDATFILQFKKQEHWDAIFQSLKVNLFDLMHSWTIGDSLRSDINPPLSLGELRGVHIKYDEEFEFETDQVLYEDRTKVVSEVGDVLRYVY